MRLGLPIGGLPRCREVGFTRRFTMDIWYGILLVFWVNYNYLNLLVIVFSCLFVQYEVYTLYAQFLYCEQFRL